MTRRRLIIALLLLAEIPAIAWSGTHVNSLAETTQLTVVSEDPYTNRNTFHRTEAEPDSFAFGSTLVSTFQVGRAHNCGASNLGWSVSTDAGATWTDGFLPGTTVRATPPGPWIRTTDPVVAHDSKHDVWLVEGLGIRKCGRTSRIFVSRSIDGAASFEEPVVVYHPRRTENVDKNWITCDNTPTSPFYGNCYTAWDDAGHHNRLQAYTSSDGGLTWAKAVTPKHYSEVQGVQPVVQPNGNVVMPTWDWSRAGHETFISTDGGASYSGPFDMPSGKQRWMAGHLANTAVLFVAVDVDAEGRIYAAWPDCTLRSSERPCSHNDIMFSTSMDGRHWSNQARIPIDPVKSSVDHFFPAIAVDPTTSGASAHIAVLYYFYPEQHCDVRTCELSVGFISSADGGSSWAVPLQLAGPFKNTWFPLRFDGYFPGDYFAVSFVDGKAVPVFTVAAQGACKLGDITSCHTWIASATIPLPLGT